jgi:hypothetical protein
MSSALELIINGYVKINNSAALEAMKAHKQSLIARVGHDGPFNRAALLGQLNDEIAVIGAGLEKLTSIE